MISLGSNDSRKGLGLGFGGKEMEETELEEGEACSYNNNNDDFDATTDPENDLSSLSYIVRKFGSSYFLLTAKKFFFKKKKINVQLYYVDLFLFFCWVLDPKLRF